MHGGNKDRLTCKQCSKVFSMPSSLTRHEQIHRNEKRYACTTCGRRFNDPSTYHKHLVTHTGIIYGLLILYLKLKYMAILYIIMYNVRFYIGSMTSNNIHNQPTINDYLLQVNALTNVQLVISLSRKMGIYVDTCVRYINTQIKMDYSLQFSY